MAKDMSNNDIVAYEGGDYGEIMDNYDLHEITAAIANRAGKAVDTVRSLEQEIEDIKNNPDVVDVVATYADLQDYDTSQLTDKDVIRVLQDETHNDESTYYRWSATAQSWTYIGESKQYTDFVGTDGTTAGTNGLVPAPATTDAGKFLKADGTWAEAGGGGEAIELTSADYDYPSNNPDGVAIWKLEPGMYYVPDNVKTYTSTTDGFANGGNIYFVGATTSGLVQIIQYLSTTAKLHYYYTNATTGVRDSTGIMNPSVRQTTGASTTDVMSQKAVTDALASAGPTVVQTTGTSTTDVMSQNATTSMIFSANNYDYGRVGIKIESDGIGGSQSVRIGHNNTVYGQGISIGWGQSGINSNSDGNVTIRGGGGGDSGKGARASNAIAIGNGFTDVYGNSSVAIGGSATVDRNVTYAIALGNSSKATMKGQMQIGLPDNSTNGYNNSQYRLLTGLYDPQSDHDAATKGYVDTAVASAGGAEEINSTDWSALWQ